MSLTWNPRFATGHERVDEQHQTLFGYVNDLEDLVKKREFDSPVVENLIRLLGIYVRIHFACEESCMEIHQCPKAAENKEQHQIFVQEFTRFRETWRVQGPSLERLKILHEAAEGWVQAHIMKVDMGLKETLARSGFDAGRDAHLHWHAKPH